MEVQRPKVVQRRAEQRGASAAEYALLVGLIAMVVIGIIGVLGLELTGLFERSCTEVSNAANTTC
jgi:pilus assembly protein Flp/PilA